MKFTREVKTGIFAIISIALFIMVYNFLKGSNIFQSSRMFYVIYDNVEGLSKSAPVTINGLQVGKVQNIGFVDTSGKLVVTFTVDNDFSFSKNSIVQIYSSGFIGGNNLAIIPQYDPNNVAKRGDTLKGEIARGILDQVTDKLGPLEVKIETTLSSLDTLLNGVNDVLDDKTRGELKLTITNLSATVGEFRGAARNINGLLSDNKEKFDRTLSNLDTTSENFARLSDSLAQVEVGQMVADLESVLNRFNGIATSIESGEGSVGKLLKDEELYDNLAGASKQLEELLQDMKLNPKRYVHFSLFGKRPGDYEKPEDPEQ